MKLFGNRLTKGVSTATGLSKHCLEMAYLCFLFSSFALLLRPVTANAQTGTFSATGSMITARGSQTATLLANGQVLVEGGCAVNCSTGVALASAELYNPATGTFSATGSMSATRVGPTATLLPSGGVLVAGGVGTGYSVPQPSAEIYNPATGTFSTTSGSMITTRTYHTATLLPNGLVLIAGGCGIDGSGGPCEPLASAELYNPATGTFSAAGTMTTTRVFPTATLLPNGQVLIAGGTSNGYSTNPLNSAELYNPATGIFSATGSMIAARANHLATLLANGEVLVATGYDGSNFLVSAELYNPATGTFSATGSMAAGRLYQSAALLADGEFMVVGGTNSSGVLASAELYNPATGTFSATGSMTTPRVFPTATLLPNGQVLLAGGGNTAGDLSSAELYSGSPKYQVCVLYDQTRSVNSGAVFPIKLYLCDTSGNDVSSSAIVLHVTQITWTSSNSAPAESTGNANPDNDFRFDSTLGPAGGYIFNLGTSGLSSGTYSLNFNATGDSSNYVVGFAVK